MCPNVKVIVVFLLQTVLYEQRTYPAQKWVCSNKVVDSSESGSDGVFMRLFRYISGANQQGELPDTWLGIRYIQTAIFDVTK